MGRTTKLDSKSKVNKTNLQSMKNDIEDKTTFFYYAFRNVLLVSLPLTIISALLLSLPHSFADNSSSDNISIELPVSCTMSGVGNTHSESLINGTYDNNIGNGVTTLTTYCNDKDGYIIYAIGNSNNEEGNTNLVGNNGSTIATGTATSGNTSNWAMKLASLDNTLTMNSTYTSDFANVPATWTEVAKKESGTTDSETGSSITTTYAVYVSNFQAAGTYSGRVKYAMFHPSSATAPTSIEGAYAANHKEKYNGYYKMQDMDPTICSMVNIYGEVSQAQLIDVRDNKTYFVAKLNDNNCWMTQNLDLDFNEFDTNGDPIRDANNNVVTRTFNSNDTDLSTIESTYTASGTIYPLKATDAIYGYSYENGVASWTPSVATVRSLSQWTSSNTTPSSYDSGEIYPEDNATIAGAHGLAGNYYNWSAAIASDNSGNLIANKKTAINSICPKGWRLPNVASDTGGYEFSKLLYTYDITTDDQNTAGYVGGDGFDKMINAPLWFIRAGYIGGNENIGMYLSSAIYNINNAYSLRFNNSNIDPGIGTIYMSRYYGMSVRCLAR